MTLELFTATALGLIVVAWSMRRLTARRVAVTAQRTSSARADVGSLTAVLMAAPPDTATGSTPSQQQATPPTAPAARKPPKRKPSGPSRRQFLRWAMGLGAVGVLTGFASASLAFIWPNLRGGFGARIPVGDQDTILGEIESNQGRFEFPEARSLIVRYDPALDPDGQYSELTGQTNIMALYQKCVHLGCKVPWCAESQWWECPCHGSKYNRWGEWQEGPAPRGLDRFAVAEEEGQILIDTSAVITGPSRSAAVLNQPPEGPHCQDSA